MLRPPNKLALSLSLSHSRYVFCTILHSAYFNSFPVFHSPLVFVTLFSCPVSLDTRTGAGFLPPLATLGGNRRRRPFPGTRLITTESELDRKIETLTATKKILLITNLSSFTSGVIRQKWNMFDDKSASQRVCHRHLNDFAKVKIEIAPNHVKC